MPVFSSRKAVALLLATSISGAAFAQEGPLVDAYVAAWVDPTRAMVSRVLGDATVFDADWGRLIPPSSRATYLGAFHEVTLELVNRSPGNDHQVVLEWRATDATSTWGYTDTLTFEGGRLTRVDWKGQPASPRDVAWAERFIAARNSLEGEAIRVFMDPACRIVGRTLPSSGYSVDGYLDFLQGLKGTVYERTGTASTFRAKDGHLYYPFRIRRVPGATLASGRDHLVLQNGLVTRLEGVY